MPEPISRQILIANFATPAGASNALDLLKGSSVSLGNTALVTRDAAGKVDFTESADWGVGEKRIGRRDRGPAVARRRHHHHGGGRRVGRVLHRLGFPDALLKQMGEGLTSDSSMLVALVEDSGVTRAGEVIAQAGGTVMGTSHETDLAAAMANLKRS